MSQNQDVQTVPSESSGSPRLVSNGEKRRLARKKLTDKTAAVVIRLGGVAIVLSIAAILFFIVAETLPLWWSPTARLADSLELKTLESAGSASAPTSAEFGALAVGVNEYRDIAYVVAPGGRVDFVSLPDNHLLQSHQIEAVQGRQVSATYHDSIRHVVALGTSDGVIIPLSVSFSVAHNADGTRTSTPSVHEEDPIYFDSQRRAITALGYRRDGEQVTAVALFGPRRLRFFAQHTSGALLGPAEVEEHRADLSSALTADATVLAVDTFQANLLVGTASGEMFHWQLRGLEDPELSRTFPASSRSGAGITALSWLLGGRSLVVGDEAGGVSVWFQVRDRENPADTPFRHIHQLRSHAAPVTAIAPSPRDKGFFSADAEGNLLLHYSTTARTLLELATVQSPIYQLAFAPRADGAVAVNQQGILYAWEIYNPHPEISLKALFGRVWYEGYERPDYTWQSSSGTDDFEPKLSLTPLAYGTLKGTFYALLLAIPISVCAALYTSQFMHPSLRNVVKPTVEVMAALPSVVLGFFAGLWLAPLVADMMPGVLLMLLALPVATLGAAFGWRLIPLETRSRIRPGTELFLLVPLLLVTMYSCMALNAPMEATLFDGNFRQWLYDTLGVRYDPRNSLIVGFAMGFAVIPIIYTICEDAFSGVPQHLISGSLALGATRWQTALRVVTPTASPGVFSAIMIGFGRAVGETMIVLMATGNTPIMNFSPFTGFRALSANIAVEIPEAPDGGTLYRVLFLAALLLFVLTFSVNTVAEFVRQRLRDRYGRI